jgi:hypothetical protein
LQPGERWPAGHRRCGMRLQLHAAILQFQVIYYVALAPVDPASEE